jgi:hypothetical protein
MIKFRGEFKNPEATLRMYLRHIMSQRAVALLGNFVAKSTHLNLLINHIFSEENYRNLDNRIYTRIKEDRIFNSNQLTRCICCACLYASELNFQILRMG